MLQMVRKELGIIESKFATYHSKRDFEFCVQ